MFLAIAPVFPGPVYLICQDPFQIITGTLSESFYCFNQAGALVVCLERYFFDTPITFAVKTEIKFCTKFNSCLTFPLAIGRSHSCKILTMRCSTEWTLFSYIYCCSYSLMMVRYKLISLPVMVYPSLMNCSRYRRALFTYASYLRIFFAVCFLLLANARYSFLARLRYLLGSLSMIQHQCDVGCWLSEVYTARVRIMFPVWKP